MNNQKAKYAIAMIWVIIILKILSLIIEAPLFLLNENILSTDNIDQNIILVVDSISSYTALLTLAASIISIITFIRWFKQVYYNIELRVGKLKYSNSWTIAGWFIPIVNLFIPYEMMKDLYTKTDQYLLCHSMEPYTERLKTNYVNGWWTLWIIFLIINYWSMKIQWSSITIETLSNSNNLLSIINTILLIVLGMTTIIVIEDYSKAEKLLAETTILTE